MEIQDIRRARLAQLIRERYDGSQARFVDETGENQGEVSGLLRTKSFGERKARKLEAKCQVPAGWLDIEDEEAARNALRTDKEPAAHSTLRPLRPELTVVENVEPQRMALVYVTQRELDLLTFYRRASDMGKSLVETAAESAAGEESATGSAHQS
jgi:3,4-dihydroxy 2-butanone 4-phosphate synthase/GTP cyclohydrolase II